MRILSPLLPCKLTAENSQLEPISPVPVETARVARAAFPKRSTIMRIRDELGILYTDETFASLFPAATCPARAHSVSWTPATDRLGTRVIKIKFSMQDCKPCPLKEHCTKAPRRTISLRTKDHHQALLAGRARQKQAEIWQKYRTRAGIEGTISQGVRAFDTKLRSQRGI
jgi:Transposase DDE domain